MSTQVITPSLDRKDDHSIDVEQTDCRQDPVLFMIVSAKILAHEPAKWLVFDSDSDIEDEE